METHLPGYDYGSVPTSPVSDTDFALLLATAGLTENDRVALRRLGTILVPQAESLVDAWRAKIGTQMHLASAFFNADGGADDHYKAAVKRRFVQWVADVCTKPIDRAWLNYQHEIGLRHTPAKKSQTDGAHTAPLIPLRYLIAFVPHILTEVEARLFAAGVSRQEFIELSSAWTKAVLLSIALWTLPYAQDGMW